MECLPHIHHPRVGLGNQPADLEIAPDDLSSSLLNRRKYVEARRDLWHTIICERETSREWVEETLAIPRS